MRRSTTRPTWWPIALLSMAAFCVAATMRVADPMIPRVALEFGTTAGEAGVIVTTFTIAYGLCQLIYGPLGDRYGKFRLITLAMTVSGLIVGAGALAGSMGTLAWLRLGAGAITAAVIPLAMAHVGDLVPYDRRQAVLAHFLSGQILGVVFGQAAGGALIEATDWRTVFVVLGCAYGLVALLLWYELLSGRPQPPADRRKGGIARAMRQYTGMLAAPRPRVVLAAVFVEGFLFFGALAYVGAFVHDRFELDFATIGLLLGCFGIGGLCYTFSVRPIVRTLGESGMVTAGGVVLAASFAALAWMPVWPGVAVVMAGVGFGFYMLHNTLQTNATQMAPEARGAGVSLFALVFFLGQGAGVQVYGMVVDSLGFAPVFLTVGPGLLILGIVFGRSRRRS
ncbi:YNFM family putative membrane transporter [Constrictibacter sp. MBR-5]|uniref:MFS transporter n=1 Tax=Constrictibacter sp. MBR-5 TaxID=3156467 RepID=UPI0033983403